MSSAQHNAFNFILQMLPVLNQDELRILAEKLPKQGCSHNFKMVSHEKKTFWTNGRTTLYCTKCGETVVRRS